MDSKGVLVTGGTGFVGSYLAKTLVDQGWEVYLFDQRPLSPLNRFILGSHADDVIVEIGAVDDWSRFADVMNRHRPSHVVHLAVAKSQLKDIHENVTVNVLGTINALEIARIFSVERIVVFSSEVVVPKAIYVPVDASHPVILAREGPRGGFYGASKLAGEAFSFAYRDNFGLDTRIIRPTAIYGHGMAWPTYIKLIVEGAVRGEPVRFDTGALFGMVYTHVEDVAGLTTALLTAPQNVDNIFYSSTGSPPVTNAELAEIVMDLIPGADIAVGRGMSDEQLRETEPWVQVSIDNAQEQFGWKPTYASMRDGVANYIEQYRAFLEVSNTHDS